MSAPAGDPRPLLTDAVRRRLSDGDWQIVAVTPASVLPWRLRAELDKTFGALHEPVLVMIERKPEEAP